MAQNEIQIRELILKNFHQTLQKILGIEKVRFIPSRNNEQEQADSIFIYYALGDSPEQEFIIDLEVDFKIKASVLYHITLPVNMRKRGLGTRIVGEIEKTLTQLGLNYISLPAEHHSTGFWLKRGYSFKFEREKQFYGKNIQRDNLHLAYELEKKLGHPD